MTWHDPWMLLLMVLLVPIWYGWAARKTYSAVRYSSVAWLKRQGASWRVRTRWVIPLLRTAAVGLLIACLARPQQPNQETKVFSEGIAIQMVADRSGSMQAMDFTINGQRVDRLKAIKSVVKDFVLGGKDLAGRPDDLIGLISFAAYADSKCPLTLDHSFVMDALDQTEIVSQEEGREEDGTAIGDAIALAVERLADMDRRRQEASARKINSKVIILLTDGENNKGDFQPDKAAELAAAKGIKIYTIGTGSTGVAPMPVRDAFGTHLVPMQVSIDEDTLKKIAQTTGGRYWRATDTDSLRHVYEEIDKLEKTKTEEKRYFQYAELATESVKIGGVAWPPLLVVTAAALALEVLLANTRYRKVP